MQILSLCLDQKDKSLLLKIFNPNIYLQKFYHLCFLSTIDLIFFFKSTQLFKLIDISF